MTALTGETGAGKTMLVEAIELLVERRADPAMVRAERRRSRRRGPVRGGRRRGGAHPRGPRQRPLPGLRRRAHEHGRGAGRRSRAAGWWTCTANMTISRCWRPRCNARRSTASPGSTSRRCSTPVRRWPAWPRPWPSSAATPGHAAREIDLLRGFQSIELSDADLDDPDEDESPRPRGEHPRRRSGPPSQAGATAGGRPRWPTTAGPRTQRGRGAGRGRRPGSRSPRPRSGCARWPAELADMAATVRTGPRRSRTPPPGSTGSASVASASTSCDASTARPRQPSGLRRPARARWPT